MVWAGRSGSSRSHQAGRGHGDRFRSAPSLPRRSLAAGRGVQATETRFSPRASSGRWSKAFRFTIRSSFAPDPTGISLARGRILLAAIAKAGVKVVCYNFMPVVDWTRTDLQWRLPTTGYALRFDAVDFAAYDLFILERKGAGGGLFGRPRSAQRALAFDSMPEARKDDLEQTIIAGLPGAEASYNRETIRGLIAEYQGVTAAELRANLVAFLREVVPVAQRGRSSPRHTPGRSAVVAVWPPARRLDRRGCEGDFRGLRYARQRADVLCRLVRSEGR